MPTARTQTRVIVWWYRSRCRWRAANCWIAAMTASDARGSPRRRIWIHASRRWSRWWKSWLAIWPAVKAAKNCSSAAVTPGSRFESIRAIISVLAWHHQSKPTMDGPARAGCGQGGRDDGGRRSLRLASGRALLPRLEPAPRARVRRLPADHATAGQARPGHLPGFAAGAAIADGAGRRRDHRHRGPDRARAGRQPTGADPRGAGGPDLAHVRRGEHPFSDGELRRARLGGRLPALRAPAAWGEPEGVAAAGIGVRHPAGDQVHSDRAGNPGPDRNTGHPVS